MTPDYTCPICKKDMGAEDVLYFDLTINHGLTYEATGKAMGSAPLTYDYRGSAEKR